MLFASLNQFYSSAGDLPVQWICVQRSNGHRPPASKVPAHRRVCGHRFPPLTTICWTLNPRTALLQWRLVNCVHCENRREKASQLLGLDWSLQVSYNLSYMSCLRAQYRCSSGWVKATSRTTLRTPGPPLVLLGTLSMRSSEHQIMEKLALRNYCKQQEFTCAKNNHMNIAQTARWTPHAILFVSLNLILGVDGYDHFPCPWPFSTGNDQTSPTFLKNVKWWIVKPSSI